MSHDFPQRVARVRAWAESVLETGWLNPADLAPLVELELATPATLFEAGIHRPLVVAFLGGTGVGKSTLLNRLAGQAVARVGVERPTSREVSLYAHESVELRQLPDGMPLDSVRFAHHGDALRRQVLWIDMPDIDSTATENRDLVIQWLPHIDVLIYVVSPERYRDDRGWRLLQDRGYGHAWLFVVNQWDRGHPQQLAHFRQLLHEGGFTDPVLFTTACTGRQADDEFAKLEQVIQTLADRHVAEQLERRSLALRQHALNDAIERCLLRLGAAQEWEQLRRDWSAIWSEAQVLLAQGLEWPIREMARRYVTQEASPLHKSMRLDVPQASAEASQSRGSLLWDDWAAMQLEDALNRLVLETGQAARMTKIKQALSAVLVRAGRLMESRAQLCLRQALVNPGNAWQRMLLRVTGVAALVLPLCAIAWVSWQAVSAYYASGLSHAGYLGVDFAIHSAILIAIAWLLPFFLNRRLRPSTERVAAAGLRLGVEQALLLIDDEVADGIAKLQQECESLGAELRQLGGASSSTESNAPTDDELLGRMLPQAHHEYR